MMNKHDKKKIEKRQSIKDNKQTWDNEQTNKITVWSNRKKERKGES